MAESDYRAMQLTVRKRWSQGYQFDLNYNALNIDLSLSKSWSVPGGNLRFRWDTFNLFNTVRFDVSGLNVYPDRTPTFGRYDSSLSTCDGRAGRCMQFALHYQF